MRSISKNAFRKYVYSEPFNSYLIYIINYENIWFSRCISIPADVSETMIISDEHLIHEKKNIQQSDIPA
jgi:hypothetical protein